jgi:signal peptidase I
MVPTLKV